MENKKRIKHHEHRNFITSSSPFASISSFIFFSLAISAGLSSSSCGEALVEFNVEPVRSTMSTDIGLGLGFTARDGAGSDLGGEDWCCLAGVDARMAARGPALEAGIRIAKDPAFGIILIPFGGTRAGCETGGLGDSELFAPWLRGFRQISSRKTRLVV